MRRFFIFCMAVFLAVLLSGCAATRFSDPYATGYRQAEREECVPYARRASGIRIRGDAWTWWDQAAGVYARGRYPAPGAIMTLARTNRLKSGHLAVVTGILNPREITVTHTNWGNDPLSRRIVYESMRVQDTSPMNDWSSARFWNREEGVYGFPYPVQGFIYPAPAQIPGPMPTQSIAPVVQPAGSPQSGTKEPVLRHARPTPVL